MLAQKGLWTLMDRKTLEERGQLPKQVHDEVQQYKAMMEENCCGRCRKGQVQEHKRNIERGDWKRPTAGLHRTELRVRCGFLLRRQSVWTLCGLTFAWVVNVSV